MAIEMYEVIGSAGRVCTVQPLGPERKNVGLNLITSLTTISHTRPSKLANNTSENLRRPGRILIGQKEEWGDM